MHLDFCTFKIDLAGYVVSRVEGGVPAAGGIRVVLYCYDFRNVLRPGGRSDSPDWAVHGARDVWSGRRRYAAVLVRRVLVTNRLGMALAQLVTSLLVARTSR